MQFMTAMQDQGPSSEDVDVTNRTATYSLSVVRLADPDHAKLALINITDSTQQVYAVCASPDHQSPSSSDTSDSDLASSGLVSAAGTHVGPCDADSVLAVNVSSQSKWVSLQPELMFPGVEGVRVEVNGQVLSRGGDVGADMIADTSKRSNNTTPR